MRPTLPSLQKLASTPFKRAQTGLFHGALIQFGNNVPFSKQKTRRTWLPNIQNKGLYSDLLGRETNVKLTTRALRTIKKVGGLDNYIFSTKYELLGSEGMRIRLRLREAQEKRAKEAARAAKRLSSAAQPSVDQASRPESSLAQPSS